MTSTDEQRPSPKSAACNQLVPVIFIKTYDVGAFPRYIYVFQFVVAIILLLHWPTILQGMSLLLLNSDNSPTYIQSATMIRYGLIVKNK